MGGGGSVDVGAAYDDNRPTAGIVLVSRQTLFAESLASQLVAPDGSLVTVLDPQQPDLLEVCRRAEPVLVILDIGDGIITGLDLLSDLVGQIGDAGVLVIGSTGDAVAEALDRGARGCLSYDASVPDVRSAVDEVLSGRTVVPPSDLTSLLERLHIVPASAVVRAEAGESERLSGREQDVLKRLAAGHSTTVIAKELGVSVPTVRKHTQNILAKLGVHSKLQAAAFAVRHGLG
jgi:two-component system, NarL family, nitrate/nitrite response regulator NarL